MATTTGSCSPGVKRRWSLAAICAVLMVLFICGPWRLARGKKVGGVDVDYGDRGPEVLWLGERTLGEVDGRVNVSTGTPESLHRASRRKRQLGSSNEFKKAVKRGKAIVEATENQGKAARSQFDKVSDLEDWGWISTEFDADAIKSTLGTYVGHLKAKGFSVEAPSVRGVRWTHARQTTHGGVKYPATGGTFALILDPDQGLMIPTSSYGPVWYVKQEKGPAKAWPKGAPLPLLRNWADVAFLSWLKYSTPANRNKLRYVANINALNQETVDVVSEALKKVKVKEGVPPKWPGYLFGREDPGPLSQNDEFDAVLGTPNVLGTGWLVARHQEVLGRKRVGSMSVFDSSGYESSDGKFQLSVFVEVVERLG